MMNIDSSISGMQAASLRLTNSANNTANMFSTSSIIRGERVAKPYVPTDIVQSSLEPSSGVNATRKPRMPSEIAVYSPDSFAVDENGMVAYPNVSSENETVQQLLSVNAFQSNVRALRSELEMMDSLLDIAA